MKKPIQTPYMQHLGASSDRRTNRWRIHCACGNQTEPSTTMLAHQTVSCYCGREYSCNYNERTMKEIAQ